MSNESTTVHVLDDPNSIQRLRLWAVIRNLETEVRFGMSLARNAPTLRQIRDQYGITATRKVQAIEQLKELMD